MASIHTWRRRLLRIPLIYKILIANSAVVALGAIGGTMVTVWHVGRYPDDPHVGLIGLFAAAGILISFILNSWVLRLALAPLDRLQAAVDRIRAGDTQVRVDPGNASDERFDRLADTFNQMVGRLEENTLRMQSLSRQILRAQEEERRRLARDLHDEAAQALTSLLVRLRLLERAKDPVEAQRRVEELRELTAEALEQVRRVALDLRPKILDDLGLVPALESRVDELNQDGKVAASLTTEGLEDRLPREIELVFYRIGQEALSNVLRHAHARSVSLALSQNGNAIELRVRDDGLGFAPLPAAVAQPDGLGLLGMRERMATIHGTLAVETAPGRGTAVIARAPINGASTGLPGHRG
jgi:two-component system sensor histidine kinase UhpB